MSRARRLTVATLVAVGVMAIAVGTVYLFVRADALPTFLGQLHTHAHHSKRGLAMVGLGVLLLAAANATFIARKPRSSHSHSHRHHGARPSQPGRASSA